SRSGGSIGIGFAIPVDRARRVMRDLVSYGEVRKPWVGIVVQELTPELAPHFGTRRGVAVAEIEPSSPAPGADLPRGHLHRRGAGPAARIGVQRGDRFLGLGGAPLDSLAAFRKKLIELRAARSTLLSIGRGPYQYNVQVALAR